MRQALAKSCVGSLCVLAASLMWALTCVAEFDLATASGVWLLDEGTGTDVKDMTANRNNGSTLNSPEWVDGRFGKALRFNGDNQFVWVRNTQNLPLAATPRTFMCSFKWTEVKWDRAKVLAGYGPVQFTQRVWLWIDPEKALGTETCYDTKIFNWDGDTEWHHLAAVYPEESTQTTDFLLYFDGRPQEGAFIPEKSSPMNTVLGPLTIGCGSGALSLFFNGIVDEVALFPYVLTNEEIRSVAMRGLESAKAVSPSDKVATSWATLKARATREESGAF